MWRWVRNWRLIAVIAIVAAILAAALWPEAVEVDLVQAARGPLQVTIDDEGETRVRERYVVSAPVIGRLQRIELEPGDSVRRGGTLARIMPAPPTLLDARMQAELSAAVEAAQAALGTSRAEQARAAAGHARAQSALRRQRDLANAGLISRDELEAAETTLHAAAESLKAAEFTVARAEYELSTARVRLLRPESGGRASDVVSPIDGVVLKRLRESESVVQTGEPLIEVGNREELEVVSDLLSTDAVRVTPGNKVLLEQWGGGHTIHGIVRRIEPSGFMKVSALGVEEQRVNVIIDFVDRAAAAKSLGDAYRVEVRIVVWRGESVLKLPLGALFRRGEEWAVFVLDGDRVRTKTVTVGHRNSTEAEISGLAEGQRVVMHPPDTLADGALVVERENPGGS